MALLFKELDQRMESKKPIDGECAMDGTGKKKRKKLRKKGSDGHLIEYEVTMQAIQLYKDDLLDLINPKKAKTHKLKIKTDFETESVYVQHLTRVTLDSVGDFLRELNLCFGNRIVASHKLNAESSRSHMIGMCVCMCAVLYEKKKKKNV